MKQLAIAISVAAGLAAAAPTTIVQSKITAGNGAQLATGKITIVASVAFLAADGTWVDTTSLVVPVINGAFAVQLEPNDTGVPSAGYSVTWQLDGAKQRTEYWVVITSSSPLALRDVVRLTAPLVTGVPISPAQLTQDGAITGQAICWLGTQWGPGNCASGSGSAWSVYSVPCSTSPIFDFSQGNIQVLNLTCNVTSSGVSGLTANAVVMFRICQQGTFSFAAPAAASSFVDAQHQTSGKCAVEWFQSIDGVHLQPIGLGVVNQ